jgi:hypothetical protein
MRPANATAPPNHPPGRIRSWEFGIRNSHPPPPLHVHVLSFRAGGTACGGGAWLPPRPKCVAPSGLQIERPPDSWGSRPGLCVCRRFAASPFVNETSRKTGNARVFGIAMDKSIHPESGLAASLPDEHGITWSNPASFPDAVAIPRLRRRWGSGSKQRQAAAAGVGARCQGKQRQRQGQRGLYLAARFPLPSIPFTPQRHGDTETHEVLLGGSSLCHSVPSGALWLGDPAFLFIFP